jgi:uncharacterized protein YraI
MNTYIDNKKQRAGGLRSQCLIPGLLFGLALFFLTTGCRSQEPVLPTVTSAMPTSTAEISTPTSTSAAPTQTETTVPTPLESPPSPQPIPTQEPESLEPAGYLLDIPIPDEGTPLLRPTTVLSVRSGPGLDYPVYGLILPEQRAQVTGASEDRAWWVIRVLDTPLEQGWVFAAYTDSEHTDEVAGIEPPPVPPILSFSPPDTSSNPYVRFRETIYAHSGPGVDTPAYGVILVGQSARTIGVTEDGQWWRIVVYLNMVPARLAWVGDKFLEVRREGAVPVVEAPKPPVLTELPPPGPGTAVGIPMAAVFLRSGPGIEYPVQGAAPAGIPITILAASPNYEWWQVAVPLEVAQDLRAWVAAPFISASSTEGIPTADSPPLALDVMAFDPSAGEAYILPLDSVMVYAGPGNEWPALGALKANNKAVVTGISADGDWYIIRVPLAVNPNGQGWVRYDYVEPNLQRSVPILEPPPK